MDENRKLKTKNDILKMDVERAENYIDSMAKYAKWVIDLKNQYHKDK